jgi:lysophosphatidylcholine acyltransferase/lyso-PAF acetyltransferase
MNKMSTQINPFEKKKENNSIYNKIKKILFSITVVPIRLLLVSSIILIQNIYCRFALFGMNKNKPLSSFRRILLFPMRILARVMLFVLGFYWISVTGRRATKEEVKKKNYF